MNMSLMQGLYNGLSRIPRSELLNGLSRLESDQLMNGLASMERGEQLNWGQREEMGRLFGKLLDRLKAKKEAKRQFKLDKIAAQGIRAAEGGGIGGVFRGIAEGIGGVLGLGGAGGVAPPAPVAAPPVKPKIFGLTYPQAGLGALGLGTAAYFIFRK